MKDELGKKGCSLYSYVRIFFLIFPKLKTMTRLLIAFKVAKKVEKYTKNTLFMQNLFPNFRLLLLKA